MQASFGSSIHRNNVSQDDKIQVAEAMLELGQTTPMEASTKYETGNDGDNFWNNPDFDNAFLVSVEMTEQ
jgi:hypothetical protein